MTADFWLGAIVGIAYTVALVALVLVLALRRGRRRESRAIAEARREIERAWR